MADGGVAALASGEFETLLLMLWPADSPPPPLQSAYVYEDPDGLCAEYQQAGADIVSSVATRPYGMREFTVRDPDGHTFTLGCGTDQLQDAAHLYGPTPETIKVDPDWLERRKPEE